MKMIMVDRLSQFLRYRLVDFIGVHDRRDDVFLAVNPTGETVCFFVKCPRILIAAPFLKILRVHINNHLIKERGVFSQSSCGDFALVNELLKYSL